LSDQRERWREMERERDGERDGEAREGKIPDADRLDEMD
jgi:hypothetical protein